MSGQDVFSRHFTNTLNADATAATAASTDLSQTFMATAFPATSFPSPPDSAGFKPIHHLYSKPGVDVGDPHTPPCLPLSPPPGGTTVSGTFSRTPGSKRFIPQHVICSASQATSSLSLGQQMAHVMGSYRQWPETTSYNPWSVGVPPSPALSPATDWQRFNYKLPDRPAAVLPPVQSAARPPNPASWKPAGLSSVSSSLVFGDPPPGARPIVGQSYGSRATVVPQPRPASAVALSVTNLDYNITPREWKKILHQMFQQFVQVISVEVQPRPSDSSNMAIVYLPNQESARYAISQCHRKKIGYKRIHVAMYSSNSTNNDRRVRSEVASILSGMAGCVLPLFKFIELYERRFHRNISVSDLYSMRDVVDIKDQAGKGRMVCLQSIGDSSSLQLYKKIGSTLGVQDELYCKFHCSQTEYTLYEESGMLPYVKIELSKFTENMHALVKLHNGHLPLASFTHCYTAAFAKLAPVGDGGVPLEHLITCVTNICIKTNKHGIKKVCWNESRCSSPTDSCFSDVSCISSDSSSARSCVMISQQLSQFSREVVDLLKRMPACQMSFSKFIPSYHHHFGRQCRVADFGFTKLQELFEAIPHVLQILGTGNQRVLYLTHRIHVRRFTADLLRVLKAQPDKQCSVSNFPELYSEVIGNDLAMANFGVCYISDMLTEISDSQVQVSGSDDDITISIPKKDQTAEEMEKTRQFAYEVIDLLKNCPQCSMPFNKFIPSYHHHYGRQCRVADYGFSKLVELFEAIPDVITVSESGEERHISLTKPELFKVLAEQIINLLKVAPQNCVEIRELGPMFHKFYGHNVHIEEYEAESLEDLIAKIPHIAYVKPIGDTNVIVMNDRTGLECLARRCFELLFERSDGEMRLSRFIERFTSLYDDCPDLVAMRHELSPAIMIREDQQCGTICLHPLLRLAHLVKTLLSNNQGKLSLLSFEMSYRQSFGMNIDSSKLCGYPGIPTMIQVMDFMVSVRGRGSRQTVLLRQDYLTRLAHQLTFKIGIYTELNKYNELDRSVQMGASSDSGLAGLSDSSMKNISVHADSADFLSQHEYFNIKSGTSPSQSEGKTTSSFDLPCAIASIDSELNRASKLLSKWTSNLQTSDGCPTVLSTAPSSSSGSQPIRSLSLMMRSFQHSDAATDAADRPSCAAEF